MKPKYIAGFFAFLLLILLLLAAGYQMSYRAVMDRQAARSEEHAPVSESISAEGEAVKEENPGYRGRLLYLRTAGIRHGLPRRPDNDLRTD